jgi:hypothetical protein
MTTTSAAADRAVDYEEIVRVVHLYTDGFGTGSVDGFKEAFHENAWIFFTDADGNFFRYLISDCLDEWAAPPKAHIDGRIISVTQAGDVANVVLGYDDVNDPSNCWVDLHNLIRVDGVWKITNKTATHKSRAGGS